MVLFLVVSQASDTREAGRGHGQHDMRRMNKTGCKAVSLLISLRVKLGCVVSMGRRYNAPLPLFIARMQQWKHSNSDLCLLYQMKINAFTVNRYILIWKLSIEGTPLGPANTVACVFWRFYICTGWKGRIRIWRKYDCKPCSLINLSIFREHTDQTHWFIKNALTKHLVHRERTNQTLSFIENTLIEPLCCFPPGSTGD